MKRLIPALFCLAISGCADPAPIMDESPLDVFIPGMNSQDRGLPLTDSGGPGVTPNFDSGGPIVRDASPGADRYVPPLRPDAGPRTPEEALGLCVDRMTNFVSTTAAGLGCDQFDERARADRSSDYNQVRVVAACIRLNCQGNQIEGHNGIPAARTCSELEDLESVLERAEAQAVEGGCPEPEFQLRVISLAEFVGGEPCDQLTCGIDGDGEPITIDNRN